MQALGFHTWKRLCMLNRAENCFKEMHYALVAMSFVLYIFPKVTKTSQPQTETRTSDIYEV